MKSNVYRRLRDRRLILSLFDHSGVWSGPYLRAGYDVVRVDLKDGCDIMKFDYRYYVSGTVHGVLAAPPCTDYTISGARWWPKKDADGSTEASNKLVSRTLAIIRHLKPTFWALENPVGRLPKLFPALGQALLVWQPWWYGDPYTKRTCLWGRFNPNLKRNEVEPVMYEGANGKRGSWMWAKLGGKSDRTKELRSVTPPGFARAFFEANP